MNFLNIIINNSNTKEARLYSVALKAAEKPDTGITINIPAAYNVIKDSAALAAKYIPHYIFGTYTDPFEALKGKFTRQDVTEFVEASHRDLVCRQLLVIILNKIGNTNVSSTPTQSGNVADALNPYGDYESYLAPAEPVKTISEDPVSIICKAFAVKS